MAGGCFCAIAEPALNKNKKAVKNEIAAFINFKVNEDSGLNKLGRSFRVFRPESKKASGAKTIVKEAIKILHDFRT